MQHYKAKSKTKFFPVHAIKAWGGNECIVQLILNLSTRERERNNNMVSIINLHIVFIYGLFNNTDSSSDHTLPNYRITSE